MNDLVVARGFQPRGRGPERAALRSFLIRPMAVLCAVTAGAAVACGRATPERRVAPLPQVSGTLAIAGLEQPVRVVRDRWGVPHISARTEADLFFAQGFVQAQDRLFQMDLWRRSAQGRLAEVLGPNFAERDAMTRRLQARVDPPDDRARADPDARAIAQTFVPGRHTWGAPARAAAPGLNAIGATAPWLPGVAAGHNARVAWDVEPATADTEDVYVERLNPANAHQVDDNARWSDTTIVKDALIIRGRAVPFPFDREYTRHGVVVAVDRERHLAFVVRWSGAEAGAAAGLHGLALLRAASSGDVRAAIENWRTPPERVSYADVAGDRGVEVAGLVPVRRGSSGSLPAPAWNGANDWIEWERPSAAGEEGRLARLARHHPDRADALIA